MSVARVAYRRVRRVDAEGLRCHRVAARCLTCRVPMSRGSVLEKTVQYFYYKLRHTNSSGPLPEFKIEPEQALELLMAANFLDT